MKESLNPSFSKHFNLFILLLCLSFLFSRCGQVDADINSQTHKTQIVVGLSGEYAKTEVATVSIDGAVAGMASLNDVVNKEVKAGMHKISAVDKNGKSAWSPETIDVLEGQTINYTLFCDAVKFISQVATFCEQKFTYPLRVYAYDVNSIAKSVTNAYIITGENEVVSFFDHGDLAIYITDAKNKIVWQNGSVFFSYGSSFTISIDCQ